jgi:hypothetical protein
LGEYPGFEGQREAAPGQDWPVGVNCVLAGGVSGEHLPIWVMEFAARARPAKRWLIKAHEPDPGLRIAVRWADPPIVLSVRDPCDAFTSIMKRFG